MEDFQKYIDLFLDSKKFEFKDFSDFHNETKNFIKNLPEFENIFNYIKNFKYQDEKLKELIKNFKEEHFLYFKKYCSQHLQKILEILQYKNLSFFQKKRVYLGVVWFCIGYYICYIIQKLNKVEKFISFKESAQSNYMVFLTCCFIYYDEVFDKCTISKNIKENIIEYTSYFLSNIHNFNNKEDITNSFLKNKNLNIEMKKHIENTERILELLFIEQKKKKDLFILENIIKLFICEKKTSVLQRQNPNINLILQITLQKSFQSIYTIFICLYPHKSFFKKDIVDLIYKFSFFAQLIDDLNDMEIDLVENNNTIFLNKDKDLYIERTLNFIYLINEELEKYDKKKLQLINFYLNIFLFNYAICKDEFLYIKYFTYLPVKKMDIDILRLKKNNFIKKVHI